MQCPHCFREVNTLGPCPYCGYDAAPMAGKYPLALHPGSILNGRYILGHVLGQGGFGVTYIAWDDSMKERVAIKEYLPTDFAGRSTGSPSVQVYSGDRAENFEYGKAQFLEEAKTLAAFIGCAGIVRVYSYFEENGTAYLSMEYVDGLPLDKYMAAQGGRLSPAEAKRLLLPLMESLEQVHAKGIVHRDIAPDNILVTRDGTAKLIDFGAARYSTGEKSKSLDVILKHGFAPYEQYMRRGRQGPWTDVYAMAATYYYAVTGKIPTEAVERKEEDTLIAPSTLGAKLGDEAEEVLLRALEVSAHDRYQSMGEFRRAMLEAAGEDVGARYVHELYAGQERAKQNSRESHVKEERELFVHREQEKNKVHERETKEASPRCKNKATETKYEKKKKHNKPLKLILLLIAGMALVAALAFGGKGILKPKSEPLDYEEKGMFFNIYDDHAELREVDRTTESIYIPIAIKGKTVTGIGDRAFANCARVFSITIPESVTSIGEYAFVGCFNLKSVTIPKNTTKIGDQVFSSCGRLNSIYVKAGSYAAEYFKDDPRVVIS